MISKVVERVVQVMERVGARREMDAYRREIHAYFDRQSIAYDNWMAGLPRVYENFRDFFAEYALGCLETDPSLPNLRQLADLLLKERETTGEELLKDESDALNGIVDERLGEHERELEDIIPSLQTFAQQHGWVLKRHHPNNRYALYRTLFNFLTTSDPVYEMGIEVTVPISYKEPLRTGTCCVLYDGKDYKVAQSLADLLHVRLELYDPD